ncbi:PREDICTED: venom serine protease 34-like [Dinoponera quadriceps]|uniref:Venom serine protease 34-like n=1 Tax=Dinoponera quadriceps TaxID=609295 RepID=A0A6P3XA89_DINQU|nr:PREDICTED: venom serine protease 34-like [Dinoponera quadriceps]
MELNSKLAIVSVLYLFCTYRSSAVLLFALRLSLCFILSSAFFQKDCNYSQRLNIGTIYYVYNPDYPNVSKGRQSCRWIAESDYRVKLTCKIFDIPQSPSCIFERLTIHVNKSVALSYCGSDPFSIESTGKFMTIELSTSFWSSGVKFLCELQAVEDDQDLSCKCGWKKPTKIVGGNETGVNEYPMMAGLVDRKRREVYCGGSIVSPKQVLTAAHCVADRNVSEDVGVLVGDHDLTTGVETNASVIYTVADFKIHPLYNSSSLENDIAILTVNSTINFSEEVGPACLPFQHRWDSFVGSYVDLLGWGTVEFGGMKSNTLQKVMLSVITNRDCRRTYENITFNQMCTYGEEKDACQFDSGGPVLWQNPSTKREVLVGIISFGIACGNNKPGVNTRVSSYIDWILSETPGTNYCKVE